MSKLQELIRELCPNGVEYKTIRETVGVNRGKRLTKRQLSDDGKYEVYHGSKDSILGKYAEFNAPENTVIIINTGGIGGVKFLDRPFWCSDGSFWLGQAKYVNPKFLYYYLSGYEDFFYSQRRVGGVPTIDRSVIEKFEIPIPPPEVQGEIVKILDHFTDLAAELQAELQARKEQYEYYRNKLLTFAKIGGGGTQSVTWMKMSEIGDICMCKRIMKEQTNSTSGIPFYKIGTFGKVADAYISRELYEDYKKRFSFPVKGEILISASGTIGRSVIYDGKDAYFQDSNIVWIHNDETKVLNKYLYYYYQIVEWNVEGGTIKRLYNNNLAKTKIAVPSLSEQERIVAILDKFEVLVNDLSQGLPAEVAAVQEQYEYYRNKLLSFSRADMSA